MSYVYLLNSLKIAEGGKVIVLLKREERLI
jgi:hypothetical protein